LSIFIFIYSVNSFTKGFLFNPFDLTNYELGGHRHTKRRKNITKIIWVTGPSKDATKDTTENTDPMNDNFWSDFPTDLQPPRIRDKLNRTHQDTGE
jgi:hypothetical protein